MSIETRLVTLLSKNNIEYTRRGNDLMVKCLNPDHDDTKPSMGLSVRTGSFYCFSCDYGGSLNKLLKLFGETVDSNMLFAVKQQLLQEKIDTIKRTNITIPSDAVPFKKPFGTLNSKFLIKHGAFTSNDPLLVDRVCFPVYKGSVLKIIEARSLLEDSQLRWVHYPKGTPLDFLLNTNISNSLVLVEGYSDYLNLIRLGIKNVSPVFGANNFNTKKLQQAVDCGIIQLITMFDSDSAGKTGASRVKALVKNKLIVKNLIPKTDPGDINTLKELLIMLNKQGFYINSGVIY